jgi:hypothetical protein
LYARIAKLHVGPVAQLGERRLRMAEARGSSPLGSTFNTSLLPRFRVENTLSPLLQRTHEKEIDMAGEEERPGNLALKLRP